MMQASVLSGLKYALHIMVHPFDGFYDMRHEKRGNLVATLIIYLAFIESVLLMQQYGGFLMYDYDPRSYNVLRSIMTVVLPIILFCIANWSFTALTDGEGRFIDIVMALGYALLPMAITNLIGTLLSNVVIENEIDFVNMVFGIGAVWSAFLIFTGILTIHQFTVKKTLFTLIITGFGMVFIVFLALLFGSIIDKLIGFISGLVTEIRLRS
ncbi:MAG TPA: YIP1 family protein [Clostridiales bacterium]|nr:YIP1 family protein [Clostridiales bacterium]